MQLKKLTCSIVCGLGLTIVPMVSQAQDQCDYIYAVHDGGLNDSQLLRYREQSGIESLGNELTDYDIEALDISPDGTLYGASGDDTSQRGYLYTFDMDTGAELTAYDVPGCKELDGISFNPSDGSLWGWDQKKGLVEIEIIANGACSTVVPNPKGFEIEDLTWDNAGDTLYFAYNDHNGADPDRGSDKEAIHRIGQYNPNDDPPVDWNVCDFEAPEIEALEMLNDDTLLVGYHDNGRQLTTPVNLQTCEVGDGVETTNTDIEGLAVCLPE